MPPMEFDLCLDGRLFQKRVLPSSRIEAAEKTLAKQELIAIQIARQPSDLVAALITIDLRPAKGHTLAALSAETQI